ncbi:MAG: hypothetical protein H6587_08905 [Flavobacteriales bacterium]|nr:hypothetical protein [Flavobacteriales bacterium]MCB9364674.1 hypothetical protein [Flavobacteriales bacterium]
MRTIKKLSLLVLLISITTTFSCTKEGKQGETGPAGTNGVDGNANVSSSTYTGNWVFTGGNEWDATINVPEITTDILNNSAINTYFSADGGLTWIALPTYIAPVSLVVVYEVGKVVIGAIGGSSAPSGTLFKVVIIEGNAIGKKPNIDYSNYYEVKGAFNLKD